MTDFDLIISGGFLVDGTGSPGGYADIGIINDQISEIGDLRGRSSKQTIDATGKTVAPGFITQHTHYCLLYTSPSPRDLSTSRMPSSA